MEVKSSCIPSLFLPGRGPYNIAVGTPGAEMESYLGELCSGSLAYESWLGQAVHSVSQDD